MRAGVSWSGATAVLFDEAMRIVPAVAKHRHAGSAFDVAVTLKGYQRSAAEAGVAAEVAWAVLTSAYSVWVQNLFELYAQECDVPLGEAIDSAIAAGANWVSSG